MRSRATHPSLENVIPGNNLHLPNSEIAHHLDVRGSQNYPILVKRGFGRGDFYM